ncbi:DUF6350 family protein [Microlunatus capsulatus]|uniref:Flp pilus assembly pilin Flp n=1 Tax=Microlunatus capsulatus TaxID=99117 RepID=A0ABS4Z5Z3_9ACTN|nr:DUF6350 family protein [Microlunatus capsulatus]MBP2416456.1 Flp pilus assembly pilin Flp [Microlunatus capsulatus]
MASLLTPRRTAPAVVLQATEPSRPVPEDRAGDGGPRPGWGVTAVAAGLLCALTGWLLVAGLAVVGWVTADPGTLVGALVVGTGLWLAGHGVAVPLGGLVVTLVPWGVAALMAVLLSRAAGFAVRSARPGQHPRALGVAAALVGAYAAPLLVAAALLGRVGAAPGHLVAVLAVLLAASLHGAGRALGTSWTDALPGWARAVPQAVLASQLVLLVAGASVLVTGLARHLDRVTALHDGLAPGLAGGLALLLAQLALAPNAVVWSGAYALGGGFTLGNGSLVSPSSTDLGVVPGLPLLGALPAEGPGPTAALWWLAAGVLAGAVAAWFVVRARPQARFDETSLVGGLAGVTGGLVFVALAWATSGDLGTLRLTGLGPLLLPLLVMAVTTLGLAGMVTGLALGLWRRARRGADLERAESTSVLRRRATAVPVRDEGSEEAREGDGELTEVLGRGHPDHEPTEVLPRSAGSSPSEDPRSSR